MKVRQRIWWVLGGVFLLFCVGFVFATYRFGWSTTGFLNKSLWDWLQLLIVPLMLAVVALLFQLANSSTERQVAKQRYEQDQQIALDKQQGDLLQAYLDRMSELLLKEELRSSVVDAEVRNVARVLTITILFQLDVRRIGYVFAFLRESGLMFTKPNSSIVSLIQADLKKINFSHANLSEADLSEANLSEADLSEADLSEANLRGADLSRANLSRANLRGANLLGVNLTGACLVGACLVGTRLVVAGLSGADLSGADLSGADLSEAIFTEAYYKVRIEGSLSGAKLSGAKLSAANLRGVDLSGADLSGADLCFAKLGAANLSGANLSGANLSGANLGSVDLSEANLRGADLGNAKVISELEASAKDEASLKLPNPDEKYAHHQRPGRLRGPMRTFGGPLRLLCNVTYATDEETVKYIQRSKLVLIGNLILPLLILLSLIVSIVYFPFLKLYNLIAIFVMLLVIAYKVINYADDVYILTTKRVIDINRQFLFFDKEHLSIEYGQIKDLKLIVGNPIYSALNIGKIIVEAPGVYPDIIMDLVKHPSSIQDMIYNIALHTFQKA